MIRWLILTIILTASKASYSNPLADPVPTHRVASETSPELRIEASDESVRCLALNVFFEARSEDTLGWSAVAFVTINRVLDTRFPDDICSVVWEPYQFSWTHDGLSNKPDMANAIERKSWERIKVFARGVLENHEYIVDPTHGSLYYHANYVKPSWRNSFEVSVEIGKHVFYINNGEYR